MYITGSIGSSAFGEAFTFDYDLPNDYAYSETRASVGLALWAYRMFLMDRDGSYLDVFERSLYNTILSGVSLDGTKYFYANPLEVWPEACKRRYDKKHIAISRQEWFGCACCPPNVARFLASLPQYIYSYNLNEIWVHIYASSSANFQIWEIM